MNALPRFDEILYRSLHKENGNFEYWSLYLTIILLEFKKLIFFSLQNTLFILM